MTAQLKPYNLEPRFFSWTHPSGLLAARLGRLSAAASIGRADKRNALLQTA